jgi:predicted nucleotidyltransferase
MAGMSFDEKFLSELVEAVSQAGLQIIIIGNAAAILHGVPVLTQDVDFMVRDHPQLEKKLKNFAKIFGAALTRPYEPSSQMIRVVGLPVQIDFVLQLSSRKSFESIRSRATKVRIGKHLVWVAALEDIIAAKEAANRSKDKATLQILKESLRVKGKMNNGRKTKNKEV